MGKPVGLGPRQVAMQQAGITKPQANAQIAAQVAAGVPPDQMVFVNPDTQVTVPANMEQGSAPTTVQDMATAPTAVQVAMAATPQTQYNFLGIDITWLVQGWNRLFKTPKDWAATQKVGTISELEKER